MESAGDQGMSYTEFSYQILQGYDFYRLYRDRRCVLQLGGTDQWGNITAGIDVIRKLEGESGNAFAITWPLMTTASGQKFGKSEGNAVWLTSDRTSIFDFYQFWLRTEDADVERYLRCFTFLSLEEIAAIAEASKRRPEAREAQRKLAELMTRAVHGEEGVREATAGSEIFRFDPQKADAATLQRLAEQVPTFDLALAALQAGVLPTDMLVAAGLVKTKSEARRLIVQGGFYVNDQPWADPAKPLGENHLLAGTSILLRSGKKNYRLARIKR
jgi:tyrosyl-tRNA synthetase